MLTKEANFSDHVAELNSYSPKQPFFFLKPPSSILLPGAGPVLRPKGVSLHYEVELGLVIGKTLRDFDPYDEKGALDSIKSTGPNLFPLPRRVYTFIYSRPRPGLTSLLSQAISLPST